MQEQNISKTFRFALTTHRRGGSGGSVRLWEEEVGRRGGGEAFAILSAPGDDGRPRSGLRDRGRGGVAASFLAGALGPISSQRASRCLERRGGRTRLLRGAGPRARRLAPSPRRLGGRTFRKGVGVRAGPDGQPDRYAARRVRTRQARAGAAGHADLLQGPRRGSRAEALSVGDCRRNIPIECGSIDLNELFTGTSAPVPQSFFRTGSPCSASRWKRGLPVPGLMERLGSAGISCECSRAKPLRRATPQVGQEERSRIDTLMTPDKFVRPSERGKELTVSSSPKRADQPNVTINSCTSFLHVQLLLQLPGQVVVVAVCRRRTRRTDPPLMGPRPPLVPPPSPSPSSSP